MINNGKHILAICTDITHIKEVEIRSQKMRSMFFSSVAHELRTPLNSIIPILRMMLELMKDEMSPKAYNYLKVILNSSLHLETVIEDALDMSRLENNKFSIFKQRFNIKEVVEEVCEIMRFQL